MKYRDNMESVSQHKVPQWYDDCKLGIFIHWGPYSVPAWAPPTVQLGEQDFDEGWFSCNPYAEWYYNSLKVGYGPTYEHHCKTYGKTFEYENFTHMWKAENWNPAEWAKLFQKAGAKYIVLTTKHHDGFCLWPSDFTDYNVCNRGPKRDLMGELTDAVRAEGMRMGAYYSGIIDWRFTHRPMLCDYDVHNPDNISYAYADYAFNQVMELIDRYHPSVLWNDIDWPKKGVTDLPTLFAHYYNTVPEGVVDDRWSNVWRDFSTKEYLVGDKTLHAKWEMCRGLGLSFGYNQVEDDTHLIDKNELVNLLIDTVANNGNLLINVGPRADGTIPENQRERLLYMGEWLEKNGEGIYGTRPWERQQQQASTGESCYFTQKDGAVYLFITGPKAGESTVTLEGLGAHAPRAHALGGVKAVCGNEGGKLTVTLSGLPEKAPAAVIRLDV